MDKQILIGRLQEDLAAEELPTGEQLSLVTRLARLYECKGLLRRDGDPLSLRLCCPHGKRCWRDAGDRRRNANKGAIALPWIGPHYAAGGALVLCINLNDASGLAESFIEVHEEQRAFNDGKTRITYNHPGYRGTMLPYCSTRSAGLLVDVIDGRDITDRAQPDCLPWVLDRIIRLQTVKCSPKKEAGKPTDLMWENCAPYLLPNELALVRARFILAFGADVWWALTQRRRNFTSCSDDAPLRLGEFRHRRVVSQVFGLAHPRNYKAWEASHDALRVFLSTHL